MAAEEALIETKAIANPPSARVIIPIPIPTLVTILSKASKCVTGNDAIELANVANPSDAIFNPLPIIIIAAPTDVITAAVPNIFIILPLPDLIIPKPDALLPTPPVAPPIPEVVLKPIPMAAPAAPIAISPKIAEAPTKKYARFSLLSLFQLSNHLATFSNFAAAQSNAGIKSTCNCCKNMSNFSWNVSAVLAISSSCSR